MRASHSLLSNCSLWFSNTVYFQRSSVPKEWNTRSALDIAAELADRSVTSMKCATRTVSQAVSAKKAFTSPRIILVLKSKNAVATTKEKCMNRAQPSLETH